MSETSLSPSKPINNALTDNQAQYRCPICLERLTKTANTLGCANQHHFDFAKEGYINLHAVQHKKSLQPGDDQNMVQARRAFLELGHYQFLRDRLVDIAQESEPNIILDLGCGEGYYTNHIQQAMNHTQVYGVDISKAAVRYAAKRNTNIHYSVASNALLPFADKFADLIVCIFAPLTSKECHRILKTKGHLITVSPAANHLFELKAHIYDEVMLHETETTPDNFEHSQLQKIEKQICINDNKTIEDLLSMTPFGWKITAEKKQKLLNSLPLSLTLSFNIHQYRAVDFDSV